MNGNQGHDRGPVRVRLRRGQKKAGATGAPGGTDGLGETGARHRVGGGPIAIRPNRPAPRSDVAIPLQPSEPACFNPDVLESLCKRIGETRAEAEVARALERISTTLAAMDTLVAEADKTLVAATLRSLMRDADLIGMVTLARASRNVLSCLGSGDPSARSATLARLTRVGERSMLSVWDLEDRSG